jgi:hypothetical protein
MSLGIEEVLRPLLRDRSVRFVFPSEVCAEAWLARVLRFEDGPRALEAERFLGWDRLKEKAADRGEKASVDDSIRRIFAAHALAGNAEAPFLSSILPREYAGEWRSFAGYVSARLPALGALPAALRATGVQGKGLGSGGARATSDARLSDWLTLRERYEAFLGGIGRFEPSFEPRELRELSGTTIIFFPELIEDFDQYKAALSSCPSVRLVSLPANAPEVKLRRPETALAELRETLSEIGSLLDGGEGAEPMEATDIAITVAGLERYRPYLEREAALLSVPLALRSGSPLAATPGGRLFAAMRDTASSGFSFDALRDLLLSPAWPWKSPGMGKGIIRDGMRLHAIASWPESGDPGVKRRVVDAWERSLSGRNKSWYLALRSKIRDITGAKDFAGLLRSYNVFKIEFLSPAGEEWDEAADLTLARCVVELEKLVRAQDETKLDAPDAFGLFMRVLESTQYVSAKGQAGVSVYDWRVGAGIQPKRHFILHASQEALVARYRGFDFLGEDLREKLRPDRDAAGDFIAAYARSGESVSFSCPLAGFDGEEAAHGSLVSLSRGDDARGEDAEGWTCAANADSGYREEALWLSGKGSAPSRLHKAQRDGLAAAEAAHAVVSGEGACLEPRAAAKAASRLVRTGESSISLDATAIDYYRSCPYAYLYLRLLEAAPEASGISFVDAFFLGDVYHAALEALFARIKAEDGRFRPDRVDAYRLFLGSCLGEAFGRLAAKRGAFVAIVLEAYRGMLEAYLSGLLETELEKFPNLEIEALEEELELSYPDFAPSGSGSMGVVLRGRIDRISRSEKGAVIVDYKKGRIPERSQVAPDDSGNIAEAQIPCYLRLVTASGEDVDSAWYVSIEGNDRLPAGSAVRAFGDVDAKGKGSYVGREGLEGLLASFDAALGDTVRGITAGSYPLAPKDTQKDACRDCGARGICRERYALRFGQGRTASVREDRS